MRHGCKTTRVRLGAWVDGELPADAAARVGRHLAACPACRAEAGALRALTRAVGRLPHPAPPPALRARLLAQAVADARPFHVETQRLEHDDGRQVQRRRACPLADITPSDSEPSPHRVVQHQRQTTADGRTVRQTVYSR